jgi:phosphoribosylglycinamide formyltransferase
MASYLLARLLTLAFTATPPPLPRILVLISGSGTNLQALLDSTLPGEITHVLSNRKSAFGLTRAHDAGIPTTYHNLLAYKSRYPSTDPQSARQAYDADLARLILEQDPDLVVCAGWMHILSPTALDPLKDAGVDIINLHPALPGQFDGKDAIERAWKAFQADEVKETGVMIHHVIHAVDRGEPIVVRRVELREGESLEELEARIHKVEHEAIVEGTCIALEQRVERKLLEAWD